MTTSPSLPAVIDSTMLVTWRACPRKFFLSFCQNLAPAGQSVDLLFGGAVAHGLEAARRAFYVDGATAQHAEAVGINEALAFYGDFVPPEKKMAKSWEGLLLCMDGYFKQWPLATDPVRPYKGAIEFSFALPMQAIHPSGQPWIYAGRFDMLAEIDGMLHGVDDKTTGGSFGPGWSEGWALRNQFLGYTWGAQQYGFPVERMLVRGMSVLKTKCEFTQALAHFPRHLLARWYDQTQRDLERITQQWQEGVGENLYDEAKQQYDQRQDGRGFDYNFGDTCSSFGGCAFNSVCSAGSPEHWYSMFAKRDWDPVRQNPEKMAPAA